ncbi:MAG: hypothetical protein J0I07_17155, partial [Myxococcales bacterium]|nr:hypothetical protein [Myxococcales bacterium]
MRTVRVASIALPVSTITLVLLLGACTDEVSSASNDASVPSGEDGGSVDSGAGPRACEEGTWNNQGCVAWSTCTPGTYVV